MLRKLLIALAGLMAVFIVAGIFLPSWYHVERSITVDRPASTVFALLNSYRSFNEWSPWTLRDPNASYVFSGPEAGVGARLSWSGDPRLVGAGSQEITESRPYERIGIHLNFDTQGEADSYFMIRAEAGATHLTWGFDTDVTAGQSVFGALMGKYFGLFFDRWVGADFEQGLARFKAFAESMPDPDFAGADIQVLDVAPVEILYVSGSTSRDAGAIAEALAAAFGEITAFLADAGIELAGQPMAITRGPDENGYRFDAAVPVSRLPDEFSGNVKAGLSPGGPAVRIVHIGGYDRMLQSYEKLAAFMAAHGLEEGPVSWEHYISDPGITAPEDIITHVYILVDD